MKTKFGFIKVLLLLLLPFYACNETFEEQIVLEESQSHGIITVKAQFDEFPELGELYRKTVTEQTQLSEMGKKNSYDFQIDSINVIKKSFENDDYYTFGLIGENDFWPHFENLVIANKEGQEPEAYLFRYSPDENYLERFQKNPKASFSGTIEAEPLDYERLIASSGGCITYTTEMCNYDGHVDNGNGPGVAGPACEDTYIVTNTVCFIGPNPFDGSSSGGSSGSGSGGGGGGSSNDSDLPLEDSDVITIPAVPIEDLHQLNSDLGFTYASSEATWLRDRDNENVARALINFLELNHSNEDIAFARNTATGFYLNALYNTTNTLNTRRPSIASLLSSYPLVKYPFDKATQYKQDYPKLTEYLMNELPKIANNQDVIDAIYGLTETPKEIIKVALQWGIGPEIIIEDLAEGRVGSYRGFYDPLEANKLHLDRGLVEALENSPTIEASNALSFFIAVTILHEYTHLGDTVYASSFWGNSWLECDFCDENEAGKLFEEEVFGEEVWWDNYEIIFKQTGGL